MIAIIVTWKKICLKIYDSDENLCRVQLITGTISNIFRREEWKPKLEFKRIISLKDNHREVYKIYI